MTDCVKGRCHDEHGYDRGICMVCSGAGCPMKKYKATFDCHYSVTIEARDEYEAKEKAQKHWRRGFDFADLVKVKNENITQKEEPNEKENKGKADEKSS